MEGFLMLMRRFPVLMTVSKVVVAAAVVEAEVAAVEAAVAVVAEVAAVEAVVAVAVEVVAEGPGKIGLPIGGKGE